MKEYLIKDIEALTEPEAAELAEETMDVKGFSIYFINFQGCFGYSYTVFKDGHHVNHANDYELHHSGIVDEEGREGLREYYIKQLNAKLFTEEELVGPVKSYDDYQRKDYFLRNLYAQFRDYVSRFAIITTQEEEEAYKDSIAGKIYDPVCFAYFDPSEREFVEHHKDLLAQLEASKNKTLDNYEYWREAFLFEMYNHEYTIALDGDYSTLTAFGNITPYDGNPLKKWFDELGFTETQRRAYYDAAAECMRKMCDCA